MSECADKKLQICHTRQIPSKLSGGGIAKKALCMNIGPQVVRRGLPSAVTRRGTNDFA
jgi:hypothetical protein